MTLLKHALPGAFFCGFFLAFLCDDLAIGNAAYAAINAIAALFCGAFVVIACVTGNDLEPRG